MKLPESNDPLWLHVRGKLAVRPPLTGDVQADVAVIGAGITGLTTALHLAKAGRSVVILEAREVASGVSGFTTAHLTEVIDTRYVDIVQDFGEEGAQLVAASSRAAIAEIERIVTTESLPVTIARVSGFLYTEGNDTSELEAELAAAQKAGVAASMTRSVPLPFAKAGLVFADQAEFHPREYLVGLARKLDALGVRIFEHTPVIDITEAVPHTLTTAAGTVRAAVVVYATHTPLSRFILQTKLARYQSYVVAFAPRERVSQGLFWDTADPYHYTRTVAIGDAHLLVVGGEDHKTGSKDDTTDAYDRLKQYVSERYAPPSLQYRWSSQVIEPVDGLPYIGREPGSENAYVSTGYSGNGMTFGTLGAMILSDTILGRTNRFAQLYAPSRIKPLAAAKDFILENVDVPVHLVAGAVRLAAAPASSTVAPGEANIVKQDGKLVALYRDPDGCAHAVSAVCPHLGCVVAWNRAEKTWDCPCHGSRFDISGRVLAGPAKTALEQASPSST